jgi:hypothetical protein
MESMENSFFLGGHASAKALAVRRMTRFRHAHPDSFIPRSGRTLRRPACSFPWVGTPDRLLRASLARLRCAPMQ